ncbi:substrate-binding domain-containing protein [Thetidibacter halocola]|uniref:Substrate-binding domain-containing protein n=1 Tax=Thetidibacter halocola TaxID=2827239 RepID=A0A8J7WCE6_9RHOB|nr:substrate-binding domain-containing protein [Thetidibacter halocola]MBS0122813.1 substrate-binding domain-containing protein [Thetidibacter halocola]
MKTFTLARRAVLNALLGATCAAALAPSLAMADSKPVIGVSVADQKSLFYIAAVDGMRAAAEDLGYELNVQAANNNSRQQIDQVNNLLVQQIGALVFISQDSTAAAAGVKAANRSGVPVIAVDQRPETGSGDLVTYIATDSVKAARDLCTWMFGQMGGKGQIAILKGVLGSTAEIQRTQGCEEALAAHPDIEVVAIQTANWDENEAFKATQNILTAHPDLDAVFGESDAMSLGAAKAARQAGRTDLISVGIDGFPTQLKAIQEGLTQATMAQIPYTMGYMAVEQAVKVINGEGGDIPELQYQDAVLVTGDSVGGVNAADFYGPAANNM